MTRRIKLPQLQNVGPLQRASLRLPLGRTYNKIFFEFGGNINRSLVTNLVIKYNAGAEKQRWKSSTHLQAYNAYRGGAADAAYLNLNFVEKNGKDESAMTLGTYAMTGEAGVQDAVIEFDLATYTVTAGSWIRAWAEVDVPSSNRLITRTRYQQKTLAGAVEEQIIIPSGMNGEQLKRVLIFGTLSLIDAVRIRRDDSDEFESLTVAQNEFAQKDYGKVPQSGLMVIDFLEHDLQGHMLNTAMIKGPDGKATPVQNLDIRMLVNAAGTFDIYTESLTTNDRP